MRTMGAGAFRRLTVLLLAIAIPSAACADDEAPPGGGGGGAGGGGAGGSGGLAGAAGNAGKVAKAGNAGACPTAPACAALTASDLVDQSGTKTGMCTAGACTKATDCAPVDGKCFYGVIGYEPHAKDVAFLAKEGSCCGGVCLHAYQAKSCIYDACVHCQEGPGGPTCVAGSPAPWCSGKPAGGAGGSGSP